MKTAILETTDLHHRIEIPALRFRAELPALPGLPAPIAPHDFLVPNPRPDLCLDDGAFAGTEPRTARYDFEPDSIFWSPESDAGDAA
jgi:hypothetical protein